MTYIFSNGSMYVWSYNSRTSIIRTLFNSLLVLKQKKLEMYYYYLSLPAFFTIVSLIFGVGEMDYWFNSRFLVLLAPLLILLNSQYLVIVTGRKQRKYLTPSILLAMYLSLLIMPIYGVVTYLDAQNGFFYKQNPFGEHWASIKVDVCE